MNNLNNLIDKEVIRTINNKFLILFNLNNDSSMKDFLEVINKIYVTNDSLIKADFEY